MRSRRLCGEICFVCLNVFPLLKGDRFASEAMDIRIPETPAYPRHTPEHLCFVVADSTP